LLAVSSLAKDCTDKEIRGAEELTNLNIQVLSSAAKFKLFPTGGEKRKFVLLEFDGVEESDGSHAIKSFSSVCLDWEADYVDIGGVNTTHVTLSASNVNVGKGDMLTSIAFDIYFVEVLSEFANGDETVTAPAVSMKFSVTVIGWPFTSVENTLSIFIDVKGAKNMLSNNASSSTFLMGDGYISFADSVVIDGVLQPATVSISRNDKTKREIEIIFPNFLVSAVFDPVVALSSSSIFPAYAYVIIVGSILSVIGIGVYWCYKRKHSADDAHQGLQTRLSIDDRT